jgi:hypothetical protein
LLIIIVVKKIKENKSPLTNANQPPLSLFPIKDFNPQFYFAQREKEIFSLNQITLKNWQTRACGNGVAQNPVHQKGYRNSGQMQ